MQAIGLMENTDKKLNVIAFETGFPNVNSFINAFKKIMKCTPSQFCKKFMQLQ
jgi:AraC-like DNA-binding protein